MNPGRADKAEALVSGPARMRVLDAPRIVVLMALAGVSRRELAKRAGLASHTYLLRVLDGRVRTVSADVAVRISEAVGAGVDDLFAPAPTRINGRADKERVA